MFTMTDSLLLSHSIVICNEYVEFGGLSVQLHLPVDMPLFTGNHADLLVIVLHKLIVNGKYLELGWGAEWCLALDNMSALCMHWRRNG